MTQRGKWDGLERRRKPRVAVHQLARYLLVDHVDRGWGTCRVVDRSEIGAGLLLVGPPWPRYPSEWRLCVDFEEGYELDPVDGAARHVVCVRNTVLTADGRLRIGVEYLVRAPPGVRPARPR